MKDGLVLVVLFSAWAQWSSSQTIPIKSQVTDRQCEVHYTVGAADDNPLAITPDEIFAANEALASKGNTEAAWQLGLAYLQGFGVRQNLSVAEHWFEIGATDPQTKSMVGQMYADGECFPHDLNAAERWFKSAGRPGDFFELAQAYRNASPPQLDKAIPIYMSLLKQTGHPEVRRAQLELGRLVLDGKYSAGDGAKARALNMVWSRIFAQEMLGREEYKIAVDYSVGEYVPHDETIWLRFCKRAAAYNIDLAQHFYVEAIMQTKAPDLSGYDEVAWTRLASEKQTGELGMLKAMVTPMSLQQRAAADAAYESLVQTRMRAGAYYPKDDPLRNPSAAALAAMPQDDPDVQLRRAFTLEKAGQTDEAVYERVIGIYRTVYERREMDIRFVLGRNLLNGTNGFPKDNETGEAWVREAAKRGSKPAQDFLARLGGPSSK